MTEGVARRRLFAVLPLGVAAWAAVAQGCTGDRLDESLEGLRPPVATTPDTAEEAGSPRPAPDDAGARDAQAPERGPEDAAGMATPGPAARSKAPPVDAAVVEDVRAQILAERRWATLVTSPTNEFVTAIGPRFDEWSRALIALSAAGQQAEADRLCEAILELRNHLGPAILPVERFDSFLRDRAWVAGRRVEAAQFFEPSRLYPGDERVLTLYRLSVYEEDRVIARYYLERVTFEGGTSHVVGVVDAVTSEHVVVARLGIEEPSYWVVRERALRDVEERFGAGR